MSSPRPAHDVTVRTSSPHSSSPRTFERSTIRHYIFLGIVFVIAVAASIVVWPLTAPHTEPSRVDTADQAHALDNKALLDGLHQAKYYKSPRVVVRTYITNKPDTDPNRNTLAWAKEHPENHLLNSNGTAPGDDTVIVTMNFEMQEENGRPVTESYSVDVLYGKDLQINPELQRNARDAAAPLIEDGDYAQAAAAAVAENATYMGAPGIRAAALWIIIIGWFVGGTVLIFLLLLPWSRRKRMVAARAHLDTVTPVVHDRIAAGNRLPDDGTWGSRARQVAAQLQDRYDKAAALLARIDSRGFLRANGFNARLASDITEFEAAANDFLAPAADMLGRLSALYERSPWWEQTWEEEIADTRAALDTSFSQMEAAGVPIAGLVPPGALADLRGYAHDAEATLETIRTEGLDAIGTPEATLTGEAAPAATQVAPLLDRMIEIRAGISLRMNALREVTDFQARDHYDVNHRRTPAVVDSNVITYKKFLERARLEDNANAHSILSFFDADRFYAPYSYERGFLAGRKEVGWQKVGDAANTMSSAERRLGS